MANRTDRCPVCSSANIRFSRKQSSHDCEECGAVWKDETLVAPLRIFLSYGHDSNVELVHRIKVDLEKRGHDVWFDKSEIKFGDDWRHSITDGILKSNRVLSFLSKHSTREPGVCRDEIAIAIGVKGGNIQTILVEAEPEVQPPVNIGHIQWLDMHDWKERRAAGKAAWKQWYHRGQWDKPDHRNAPRVVRSIAFQLATRLPDYRKFLLTLPEIAELDRKDAAELFDYLLANPLRSVIHGGRERYLIVIDALDEAGEAGRNPLVEMLAHNAQRLPDWLGYEPVLGTN